MDKTESSMLLPEKGSLVYTYVISFVAAVGGLLFGFDTGVISGAIAFITQQFQLNAHQSGFAVSNLMIACTLGAMVSGYLADRYGRKRILILAALFFGVSALCSALARTFPELVVARFVGGLGVGIASVVSPMYIAEISPAAIRGRLVAFNQLAITTGILLSYFSDWLLVDIGSANWRWMFAVGVIPSTIFFIALFFIPESPRWQAGQGNEEPAKRTLARIGGTGHANKEMDEIKKSLAKEKGTLRQLLQPGYRKALAVGVLLALFAHITGIDTIIYYGPVIFIKSGYQSASSAMLASVMIGVVCLLSTLVGVAYVDRFGRRGLLLVGHAGMAIAMALVGFTFHLQDGHALWILFPILVYIAFFNLSVGSVIWVYVSEIFPNKIRGRAVSIATFVLWFSNVVITQLFPWMIEKLGGNTFYIFGLICVFAIVFVWTMLPETKNRSLEGIEDIWFPPKKSIASRPGISEAGK